MQDQSTQELIEALQELADSFAGLVEDPETVHAYNNALDVLHFIGGSR